MALFRAPKQSCSSYFFGNMNALLPVRSPEFIATKNRPWLQQARQASCVINILCNFNFKATRLPWYVCYRIVDKAVWLIDVQKQGGRYVIKHACNFINGNVRDIAFNVEHYSRYNRTWCKQAQVNWILIQTITELWICTYRWSWSI